MTSVQHTRLCRLVLKRLGLQHDRQPQTGFSQWPGILSVHILVARWEASGKNPSVEAFMLTQVGLVTALWDYDEQCPTWRRCRSSA